MQYIFSHYLVDGGFDLACLVYASCTIRSPNLEQESLHIKKYDVLTNCMRTTYGTKKRVNPYTIYV